MVWPDIGGQSGVATLTRRGYCPMCSSWQAFHDQRIAMSICGTSGLFGVTFY